MRLWLLLSATLLASTLLGFACNTVDPGECWENTSGGLGGTGTVPLGTGDSSGSDGRSPPLHPLTAGTPNPCVSMGNSNTPPSGQITTAGPTTTGSGISAEDQAALDELANADPAQVAAVLIQAEYSAYDLAGLINQSVTDPSTASDAMLNQLASQDAPTAEANALQYEQSDASAIPLWSPDPDTQATCVDKYACNYVEKCNYNDGSPIAVCPLASCGTGKCNGCPNLFGLPNLVVSSWCAHVCFSGGKIVGYAANIHWTAGGNWLYCYKAANGN